MFCSNCGLESEAEADFCGNCGKGLKNKPAAKGGGWSKYKEYAWIIALILAIGVVRIAYENQNPDYEANFGEITDEELSIYDLEPNIEPLGYFTEPDLFESTVISDEEWFSYLIYLKEPPSRPSSPASAVVKVLCEDAYGDAIVGSGTNFSEEGYILTNYHVIKESSDGECIIGFPNSSSGLIEEMYWAEVMTGEEEAGAHDLAILSITEPVFDKNNDVFGYYKRLQDFTFPAFEQPNHCTSKNPTLGQEIRILGYPLISGGALTITNGLISSFYSQDNYIVTSAKINGGNSGGLAVDTEGCFIGVPVAAYGDIGDDPLGEIIDSEFVIEFLDALPE